MGSIKKIVIFLTVILSLIGIILIIANINMSIIFENLDKSAGYNLEISESLKEIDLPMRVIINISQQDVYEEVKEQRLREVLFQKTESLKGNITNAVNKIDLVSESLNKGSIIVSNIIKPELFELNLIHMKEEYLRIEAEMIRIEERNTLKNGKIMEIVVANYEQLEIEFHTYNEYYVQRSADIRNQLMYLYNITLILLFLSIFSLILIVIRLLNTDLKFIEKTYYQIEHHDFDVNKVLNKPLFKEEVAILGMVKKYFDNQKAINGFKELVSKNYVIDDIMDHLLNTTNELMAIDRVDIAYYDQLNNVLVTEYGVAKYDRMYIDIGHVSDLKTSSLRTVIETKEGLINNNLLKTFEANPDSEGSKLSLKEGIRSNLTIPLIIKNEVFGVVIFGSKKSQRFTQDDYDFAASLIYEITGVLNRSYLMKIFVIRMTNTFARLVDKKDIETGEHLLRMEKYSYAIAQSLNHLNLETHLVDNKLTLAIKRNAAIHDIGKVGTPDYILKKPGKLTHEEYEEMKLHATIGGDIFKDLNKELSQFELSFYKIAENIARYHHEKWDGTGYPEQLAGYDIPIEARIIAVADVFDAISSKRVYKEAWSFEQSLEYLQKQSGKQFDPVIIEAFMKSLTRIREIFYNEY